MTLFDLALKNVKHNLRSYGLYVGSTVFAIVMYFTFVTLKFSDDIEALAQSSTPISGLMSMSAFVLIVFVAIFILYSNSFFMKKRKKEVALYSLLGIRKKSIGMMLFFENLVIGLVALVIGIVLGFFLSQGLLVVLIKLMGLESIGEIIFSTDAVLQTAIVFAIIFLFTSFQGYRLIYQFKLIDLFHASKQGEKLPKGSLIVAFIGVALLASSYYVASEDILTSKVWRILSISTPLAVIGVTVVGTYLLFHSVLVVVLKAMKNNKRWAWQRLNMMTASQLLYRIRGNAKTFTLIAVLSATTLTAGGAVFGLYYYTGKTIDTYTPHTLMWQGKQVAIDEKLVDSQTSFTSKEVHIQGESYEYSFEIVPYTKYKELASMVELDVVKAPKEREAFKFEAGFDKRYGESLIGTQFTLNEELMTVAKNFDYTFVNSETVGTVLVVNDEVYEKYSEEHKTFYAVNLMDAKNQIDVSNDVQNQLTEEAQFSSAVADYKLMLETMGALLFVGSFLGLVFLVATGSVIFFKVLTEAEEDKEKYKMLHKIGVSQKDIKATIRAQVGITFAVPLGVGLLHSAFALVAVSNLLAMDILMPVIIWMIVFVAIYLMYFVATTRAFYKTIWCNLLDIR